MKIVEIKHIEDCFDGTFIKEMVFDKQIDHKFIMSLKKIGDLAYYPDFARPFFKLVVKNQFSAKGVEGNYTMRILLMTDNSLNNLLTSLFKKGGRNKLNN